ncbi:hypothetical protein SUGI_0241770 [Cryptomeria japonica]|nr:hypothetical protein SUGI_0241770 [Cryptomeria japonica]
MEQRAREMSKIVYSCAACKIQRRKCGDKCVLAPYFPPNDLHKFLVVHKLFGTSNIVKIIKDIPVENRADTVSSMVYEARARMTDPIYGCTDEVCRLRKQVLELQSQLATTQAELLNTQANLMSPFTGFSSSSEAGTILLDDTNFLQDDHDLFGL